MICVFDAGNTNYTGNGDAVLQPKECKVKNIAGGNYDLTMTHPIDAAGKWAHLKPGAVIRVPVPREEIENAYAGEDVDVYKTTAEAALREGPSEPTTINYPGWSQYNTYSPGSKVTSGGKNYECTYFDQNSPMRAQSPGASSWWREIARTTSGAAALVTLPTGTDLYWIEDYDSTWAKLSTFYGIVGYIKKEQIQYDRHLDPEETQPRIITTQLFRVEKPTVDTKSHTVSVNAKHVSYDLNGVLVRDVKISQASPAMALGRITAGFMMDYAGTIATNLKASENGTYTQDIKGKNGMFALLDPDKGIVSTFNAAFRRDNWDLFVMKRVDTDRGYRIKYRKNMLGVNWAEDSSGLVTRVVPVAKDEKGEDLYLPETWIDSNRIGDYPVVKMERLTVKGQVGKDKGLGDDSKWTLEDLLDEMRTKARERFTVDMADRVNSTVTVDFEQIGDTEEYKEYKNLGTVLLYDTVRVENDEISLGMNLYVSEWEWDAIREKMLAVKLVNTTKYAKGTVTGYNVQAKSIGSDKLSDDVTGEIMRQVEDIIPEYTDPGAARPGIVTVTDSDPTLSWGTRSKVGEVSGTGLHVTMPGNPLESLDTDTATPTDSDYTIKVGSPSKKITFAKVWAYIKSKLGISGSGSTAKYLDQQGNWTEPPGTYSLPTASSSTKGGIKTGYTQSGKNYPVQMSGENAYVNVPWTDTDGLPDRGVAQDTTTDFNNLTTIGRYRTNGTTMTNAPAIYAWGEVLVFNYGQWVRSGNKFYIRNHTGSPAVWGNWVDVTADTIYTLPLAANGTRGGVQVGYTQSGKNYPVQLSGEKMYVNVPWTDESGNNRVLRAGDTMTGALAFANNTMNNVGDDCAMGDQNVAGAFCLKGLNGTTKIRLIQYNGTEAGTLTWDGTKLTVDKEFRAAKSGATSVYAQNTDKSAAAVLHAADSGNHGLYSDGYWNGSTFVTAGTWIAYRDTNNKIRLNGTANEAELLMPTSVAAFTSDTAGNFTHKRNTATDYWALVNNAGAVKHQFFWETGDVLHSGNVSGATVNSFEMMKTGTSYSAGSVTQDGIRVNKVTITDIPTSNHGVLETYRNVGTPFQYFHPDASYYIYKRYGATYGAWTKISAGYADSAGNGIKSVARSGTEYTVTRENNTTFTFPGTGLKDYGSFSQAVGRITVPAGTQMIFAVMGANSNDNGLFLVTVNSSGTSTALVQIYKGSNLNVSVSGNVLSISMNNSNTAHAYGLLLKE